MGTMTGTAQSHGGEAKQSGVDGSPPLRPLSVSVVVGVRNMEKTVGRCIESILACEYLNKEIIIVDDGSKDGTREAAARYPVKLISTQPKGISYARNLGFQNSSGEIVAYTDGDCVVTKYWLRNLVRHFEDGKVALVGGTTEFMKGDDISSACRRVEFRIRYSRVPKNTVSAMGPCSAFRKSALSEVGGFNPHWFHGEDAELSYTIHRAGLKIVHDSEALVYHIPEESVVRYLRKRVRDATAFVRVAYHHPVEALADRFISLKMVIQPLLFATMLALLPLYLLSPMSLIFPLATSIICLTWNTRESYLVYKETKRRIDFLKASGLLFIRGVAWGLGLILGVLRMALQGKNQS